MSEETQEQDLNLEEDTSADEGQSAQNDTEESIESEEDTSTNEDSIEESEEDVESLKARLEKAERDRDNYKRGLLSKKGKNRDVSLDPKSDVKSDPDEQRILSVLYKGYERQALNEVRSAKSEHFIQELADPDQFNEIIGYLPRNLDKSSKESIVRALKVATEFWKKDRGIEEKPKSRDKSGDLAKMNTKSSGSSEPRETKKSTTPLFKKSEPIDKWY